MGADCSTECCKGETHELEIDEPRKKTSRSNNQRRRVTDTSQTRNYTTLETDNNTMEDLLRIVRIQALIRGFIQRQRHRINMIELRGSAGKYFTYEESMETLDGKYDENAPIEERVYTYQSQARYSGQWKGGLRHGKGVMKWADGAYYEGEWDHNQASGKGKFHHLGGDIYEGNWKNSKAYGQGLYLNSNGARYEGEWVDEQQHGKGVEEWKDGARYEGDYFQSKKQGTGRYQWADGSFYEGQWENNQIQGEGLYNWRDGRHYYGQWLNNNMSGYGIYFYPDGIRYDGQYELDKKEGYGIYRWVDGRQYDGYWHEGRQHGLGVYSDSKKNTKKYGIWENGRRLKWFGSEEIELIKEGRFDIASMFKEDKSKKFLSSNQDFEKPRHFQQHIDNVKQKF